MHQLLMGRELERWADWKYLINLLALLLRQCGSSPLHGQPLRFQPEAAPRVGHSGP